MVKGNPMALLVVDGNHKNRIIEALRVSLLTERLIKSFVKESKMLVLHESKIERELGFIARSVGILINCPRVCKWTDITEGLEK